MGTAVCDAMVVCSEVVDAEVMGSKVGGGDDSL